MRVDPPTVTSMRPRTTIPPSSPRVAPSSSVAAPTANRECSTASCRAGRLAAMSRRETSAVPTSASSSAPKNACGTAVRSSAKNSARVIETPSSTFVSELTEGLTRFCSMREIRPLVTPARRASSRWDIPKVVRTVRRRAPTSIAMIIDQGVQYLRQRVDANVGPRGPACQLSLSSAVLLPCPDANQAEPNPMSTVALTPTTQTPTRSELEAHWMPFTANRQFKARPRILAKASGMHYWTPDGRQILDGVAGLWCVNAGHGRREISEAVAHQLETMDYAPPFQMGHPLAFELANAVAKIAPAGLDHVFFTNSGSESVESALKIALAYHRVRGDAARTKLIGRERAYHGVNFGG